MGVWETRREETGSVEGKRGGGNFWPFGRERRPLLVAGRGGGRGEALWLG